VPNGKCLAWMLDEMANASASPARQGRPAGISAEQALKSNRARLVFLMLLVDAPNAKSSTVPDKSGYSVSRSVTRFRFFGDAGGVFYDAFTSAQHQPGTALICSETSAVSWGDG
jgi:hypothetical protein